jgi:hypothetical protein
LSDKIDFNGVAFEPILDFHQMRAIIQALSMVDQQQVNYMSHKILELRTYLESMVGQKTIERWKQEEEEQ